jgi:prepilin-type processing-associated H-X9-DG protein
MRITNGRWMEAMALVASIVFALSIFFPAASTARSGGKSTLCLTNLHILGRAWLAYQEDNHGKLVNGLVPRDSYYANQKYWQTTTTFSGPYKDNAWWVNPPHNASGVYTGDPVPCSLADEGNGIRSGKLYPYVGTSAAYHCPNNLSYLRATDRGGWNSYSIIDLMHGERPNSPECADLYSQIVRPSVKMVFVENTDNRGWNMGSWMMSYSPPGWVDTIPVFHGRQSAFGFADGHAEFHTWASIDSRTGQPTSTADLNYLASIYLPKR